MANFFLHDTFHVYACVSECVRRFFPKLFFSSAIAVAFAIFSQFVDVACSVRAPEFDVNARVSVCVLDG